MSFTLEPIDTIYSEDLKQRNSPALQTARGKLQKERSKLNEKINRQCQLRNGAENLLSGACSVPMIAVGLKETKDVNFKPPINDFLAEHYGVDVESFSDAVSELTDMRRALRTPSRNEAGISLLHRYVNQLTRVELRFFPRAHNPALHFQWYDAFTGLPDCQKSIGFEKGSVIFNVAALYSQIATKYDRTTKEGIGKARAGYQRAAGSFQYLKDKFSHPPSRDMQPDTLETLIALMMAQVEECVLEESVLGGVKTDMIQCADVARLYARVAQAYAEVTSQCKDEEKSHLPRCWVSMMEVKSAHYNALAHYYVSMAISDMRGTEDESELRAKLPGYYTHLHNRHAPRHPAGIKHQREQVLSELRESSEFHDQALHLVEINKHLRKMDILCHIVSYANDRTLQRYKSLKDPHDYSDILQCPVIQPDTTNTLKPILLNLDDHPVEDLFKNLGPLWLFCANRDWSSPRHVTLERDDVTVSYGFRIRGGAPVMIEDVESGSCAELCGVKPGDVVLSIDNQDAKWYSHQDACDKIRQADDDKKLSLTLVTLKAASEPSESIHSNASTLRIAMMTPSGTFQHRLKVSMPELSRSLDDLSTNNNNNKKGSKLSFAFRKRRMWPSLGRR